MRLLIIVMAVLAATPSLASIQIANPMSVCQNAARQAEKKFSIPAGLLQAITLVETGRYQKGATTAWPWTVNVSGKGHYFQNRTEAEQFVSRKKRLGVSSIDIGCFQINTKWHGQAFETPLNMFDPAAGASYAAAFLSKLHKEHGDWNTAVKSYHSRTAHKGAAYGLKIAAALETLGQTVPQKSFMSTPLRDGPVLTPIIANRSYDSSGAGGVKLMLFTNAEPLFGSTTKPLLTRKE